MREHPVSFEHLVAEVLGSQGLSQTDPEFPEIVDFLDSITYVLLANWLMKLRVAAKDDLELINSLDEFGLGLVAMINTFRPPEVFSLAYETLDLPHVQQVLLLGIFTLRYTDIQALEQQCLVTNQLINHSIDQLIDEMYALIFPDFNGYLQKLNADRFISTVFTRLQHATDHVAPPSEIHERFNFN